ncbi:MAG: archaellum component FlaF (FlaF/FlaG flagellin family) [Candidatus Nanohaloarchaea archaeon]|jgi:archaellum component FlaF (FlaF/FlaG flagellin family)
MKGLSQVITSALILAVGISVAGVYANWAPDFAERVAEDTADQQNQDLRCRNAGIRINGAVYDLTGNFTEVEITNIGTIDLRDDLTVTSVNQSRVIGNKEINQIEVESTRIVQVESDEKPESVVITSSGCPDLEASIQNIEEK